MFFLISVDFLMYFVHQPGEIDQISMLAPPIVFSIYFDSRTLFFFDWLVLFLIQVKSTFLSQIRRHPRKMQQNNEFHVACVKIGFRLEPNTLYLFSTHCNRVLNPFAENHLCFFFPFSLHPVVNWELLWCFPFDEME